MTNHIFIDINTERERPIIFGKPPDVAPPENKEEAAKMILNDIACLAEAISTLILMAEQNEYGDKEKLATATINTINDILNKKEDEFKKES